MPGINPTSQKPQSCKPDQLRVPSLNNATHISVLMTRWQHAICARPMSRYGDEPSNGWQVELLLKLRRNGLSLHLWAGWNFLLNNVNLEGLNPRQSHCRVWPSQCVLVGCYPCGATQTNCAKKHRPAQLPELQLHPRGFSSSNQTRTLLSFKVTELEAWITSFLTI